MGARFFLVCERERVGLDVGEAKALWWHVAGHPTWPKDYRPGPREKYTVDLQRVRQSAWLCVEAGDDVAQSQDVAMRVERWMFERGVGSRIRPLTMVPHGQAPWEHPLDLEPDEVQQPDPTWGELWRLYDEAPLVPRDEQLLSFRLFDASASLTRPQLTYLLTSALRREGFSVAGRRTQQVLVRSARGYVGLEFGTKTVRGKVHELVDADSKRLALTIARAVVGAGGKVEEIHHNRYHCNVRSL